MRYKIVLIWIAFTLSACSVITEPRTPQPSAIGPTQTTGKTLTSTAAPAVKLTPTMCTGWQCLLSGVVYASTADPVNRMEGVEVKLSQQSNCSPTGGEHVAITGTDGSFAFDIYLHDTDSFLLQIELDNYEPASQLIGGFDCLFCSCPPFEIILQPEP
jgi:hypothetical protein